MLACGGRLGRLADLRHPLDLAAVRGARRCSCVAFPAAQIPWSTGDSVAVALQYGSYACLIAVTVANRRLPGALVLGAGHAPEPGAIVANGGHMPATAVGPARRRQVSLHGVHMNSVALADPRLPWLVDRFATPRWVPFASIFSVGDVLIVVGAGVILWSATGAHLPRAPRRRSAAGRARPGRRAERHPVVAQQRRQLVRYTCMSACTQSPWVWHFHAG